MILATGECLLEDEMRLEDLCASELEEVMPSLRAIRHDLGRYICFERRFLVDVDDVAELRRALTSDIQMTRKSGEDSEACWGIWKRLRPSRLDGDPDVRVIDQAIEDIMSIDLEGSVEDLRRASELTEHVRVASRKLLERGREIHGQGLHERPDGVTHG